jgi:hypothetical protein
MFYRILLISIIISLLPFRAVHAQDSRYRVEVLVLTQLGHDQQPQEVRKLEDLSDALDFLTPPSESAEDEEPITENGPATENAPVVAAAPAELQQDALLGPGGEELASAEGAPEEDPLDLVVHVEEMGPEMQEAWRRLRLSAPFRPLQYLAWEQGSREPFPVLRIHDLEAVLVEDPWAEQRLELENPEGSLVFGDTVAATTGADSLQSEAADPLPDPIAYYRLDGTVSLVRRRFLHLAMAIEWREPVFDEALAPLFIDAPAQPPAAMDADAPRTAPPPSAFLVHRLEQSRPVRSGRMEYFDGPVLGVLAWITDISDTLTPEPTE